MNTLTKPDAVTWPKLQIIGANGQVEKIVEMSEGARLGLCENVIGWLHSGEIQGTTMPGDREAFRYTKEDAAKSAGVELLTALVKLRRDHEVAEPHHASLCDLCRVADAAIAAAGGAPLEARHIGTGPDEYLHRTLKLQTERGVNLANLIRELVALGAIRMGDWDESAAQLLHDFDKANDQALAALAFVEASR